MTRTGTPPAQRRRMVERLQRDGIRDPRVLDAFSKVPREEFLAPALRPRAYEDVRLPIGEGQTMSLPWTVARMTELAQVSAGDKVLEIGAGSGYSTAVLAALGAIVYSVERHASLARSAAERLRALGFQAATVKQFDGSYGWAALAPFRAILITAAAPEIPQVMLKQLGAAGRLVVPVAALGGARGPGASGSPPAELQRLIVVIERDGSYHAEDHGEASFVPLIGRFGYQA